MRSSPTSAWRLAAAARRTESDEAASDRAAAGSRVRSPHASPAIGSETGAAEIGSGGVTANAELDALPRSSEAGANELGPVDASPDGSGDARPVTVVRTGASVDATPGAGNPTAVAVTAEAALAGGPADAPAIAACSTTAGAGGCGALGAGDPDGALSPRTPATVSLGAGRRGGAPRGAAVLATGAVAPCTATPATDGCGALGADEASGPKSEETDGAGSGGRTEEDDALCAAAFCFVSEAGGAGD